MTNEKPLSHEPYESDIITGDYLGEVKTEKPLSEKVFSNFWIHTPKDTKEVTNVVLAQDVKKAVEKLKKCFSYLDNDYKEKMEDIDKIFGEFK